MKKILFILLSALLILACTNDVDLFKDAAVDETIFPTAQSKGGPKNYITLEQAQVLIDSAVQAALSKDPLVIDSNVNFTKGIMSDFGSDTGNIEYRNVYYGRRETAPSQEGIKFLEEYNDRDWEIDIAGNGGFTSIWLDGNGGDSDNNITLSTDGRGTWSKYWQTQNWIMFTQYKGIYNFQYLRTFNTNEEAKAYFSSAGFSRTGSIYKTPDGILKVTY